MIAVTIDEAGFRVAHRDAALGVSSDGGSGPWTTFEHGAVRATPYGSETIAVERTKTEQYLTVVERQGRKTWRWRLDTADPRANVESLTAPSSCSARRRELRDHDPPGGDPGLEGPEHHAGVDPVVARPRRPRLAARARPRRLTASPPLRHRPGVGIPLPARAPEHGDERDRLVGSRQRHRSHRHDHGQHPRAERDGLVRLQPRRRRTRRSSRRSRPRPTACGWIVDPAGGATGFPAGTWSFAVQTDIPNGTFTAGTAVMTDRRLEGNGLGGRLHAHGHDPHARPTTRPPRTSGRT